MRGTVQFYSFPLNWSSSHQAGQLVQWTASHQVIGQLVQWTAGQLVLVQ